MSGGGKRGKGKARQFKRGLQAGPSGTKKLETTEQPSFEGGERVVRRLKKKTLPDGTSRVRGKGKKALPNGGGSYKHFDAKALKHRGIGE